MSVLQQRRFFISYPHPQVNSSDSNPDPKSYSVLCSTEGLSLVGLGIRRVTITAVVIRKSLIPNFPGPNNKNPRVLSLHCKQYIDTQCVVNLTPAVTTSPSLAFVPIPSWDSFDNVPEALISFQTPPEFLILDQEELCFYLCIKEDGKLREVKAYRMYVHFTLTKPTRKSLIDEGVLSQ